MIVTQGKTTPPSPTHPLTGVGQANDMSNNMSSSEDHLKVTDELSTDPDPARDIIEGLGNYGQVDGSKLSQLLSKILRLKKKIYSSGQ